MKTKIIGVLGGILLLLTPVFIYFAHQQRANAVEVASDRRTAEASTDTSAETAVVTEKADSNTNAPKAGEPTPAAQSANSKADEGAPLSPRIRAKARGSMNEGRSPSINEPQSIFGWTWPQKLSTESEGAVTFSIVTGVPGSVPLMDHSATEGAGSRPAGFKVPNPGPLANAYGPGYQAFATVHLDAPSFKTTTNDNQPKRVEEDEVKWQWILTPESTGPKLITLKIRIDWQGKDRAHPPHTKEWSQRLDTKVRKPYVKAGTFDLLPWLSGIAGTGLTGVFGLLFYRGKRAA